MFDNIQNLMTKRQLARILGVHIEWDDELRTAQQFCFNYKLDMELSFCDYEVARIIGYGARVLIYPHKVSSTGNIHLRLRDHGSKNRVVADRIMNALYYYNVEKTGCHSCTFTRKNSYRISTNNNALECFKLMDDLLTPVATQTYNTPEIYILQMALSPNDESPLLLAYNNCKKHKITLCLEPTAELAKFFEPGEFKIYVMAQYKGGKLVNLKKVEQQNW